MAQTLYGLSIWCANEHADLVAELLTRGGYAGVEQRDGPRRSGLIAYARSHEERQALTERAEQLLRKSGFELADYADPSRLEGSAPEHVDEQPGTGHELGDRVVVIEPLAPLNSDWETAWIEHLEPVRIAEGLVVAPGNARPALERGERCLRLEAELTFGFGDHPTTRLAARELIAACRARATARVLDVGTGTGVLALLALMSGAAHATGIDLDARAIASATRNAAHNGLEGSAHFGVQTTAELTERYDVVVANIELNALLAMAAALAARVAAGGLLLLTGILDDQAEELEAALVAQGLNALYHRAEDDWALLALRAPNA